MTKTAAKKTDDAKRTRGEKKTWEYRLETVMSPSGDWAVGCGGNVSLGCCDVEDPSLEENLGSIEFGRP